MTNKLKKLIDRYHLLYSEESVDDEKIKGIEEKLDVVLPCDFKVIAKSYSGGLLGLHSIFTLYDNGSDYNIIDKTLYYRECDLQLPSKYVALEETEVSFIVMKTQDSPEKPAPVIYCSIEDIYNLAENKPLQYNPTIFPSFTDFFEYLIEQEEQDRQKK